VPEISRRSVLKALTAVAAGAVGGAVIHGYEFERHTVGLTQAELPISGLPSAFDGLRVGFITDLHHSTMVGVDDINRAVSLVAAATSRTGIGASPVPAPKHSGFSRLRSVSTPCLAITTMSDSCRRR